MHRATLPVGLFVVLYAVLFLRGVVAPEGTTAVDQLPLNMTNKALALAAVGVLAVAMTVGPIVRRKPEITPEHPLHPRPLGWAVLSLGLAHTVASTLMMSPVYMDKFYPVEEDVSRMHLAGEMSMIAGVLALMMLLWQALLSHRIELAPAERPAPALRHLGMVAMCLAGLHVAFMGYDGWFDLDSPQTLWLAYDRWRLYVLPPSTFIGMTLVVVGIVGNIAARRWVIRQDRTRGETRR